MSLTNMPIWIKSAGLELSTGTVAASPQAGDNLGWAMGYYETNEDNLRIANKLRDIAATIDDEDIVDAIETIADEVEVDMKPKVPAPYPAGPNTHKIQTEMEKCLEELVCELGWLIDEEEIPGNDYSAPRRKTRASRRLREILLKNVPLSHIPGCTPWLQDEQDNTNE